YLSTLPAVSSSRGFHSASRDVAHSVFLPTFSYPPFFSPSQSLLGFSFPRHSSRLKRRRLALEFLAKLPRRLGDCGHLLRGNLGGVYVAFGERPKPAIRIQEYFLRVVEFRQFLHARHNLSRRLDFIRPRIHHSQPDFFFVFVFLEDFQFTRAWCRKL